MRTLLAAILCLTPLCAQEGLLRTDHYVRVTSAVPAIQGQTTQIYVREVVRSDAALRGGLAKDRVALFIHGAGTPAEVAFDVPYAGYSWMEHLANAGFDVFAMDMTGYGWSTRPLAMNDPCNLSAAQQALYVPQLLAAPCTERSYGQNMTTLASDWNDIDGVVEYVRKLRGVEQVNLLGWSLGGPRSAGYTAKFPAKVRSVVILAPAYNRNARAEAPAKVPAEGAAFNTQSRAEFVANWDRQVGCPGQYEPAVLEAVWKSMVESDPVGATWGGGVRRAPQTTSWGWTRDVVSKTMTPMLLVAGLHDGQVPPARVREMYEDLGSPKKVLLEMECASHNAMWEKVRTALFDASVEWLTKGTVQGKETGALKTAGPVSAKAEPGYTVDSAWAKVPGGVWDGSTSWITADGRGNIVVLVRTAPYFRMFRRDGTFVRAWGTTPEIASAHSVTIDRDNNYWVTDSASHQVLKFNAQGDLLMTLGTKGKAGDNTSRDLFNQPNHVAIAPNGDIYVSDGYVNARVMHFDKAGKFVRIIGGTMGKEPGQLQVPHGVALDSKGRILVNDSDNARVSVFDAAGKFVESWPYPSRGGIVVAADDTVYVSDVNAGVVNVVRDGKHVATYRMDRSHGLGVDTDGSIYASGASRMTVMKVVK